MSGYSDNPFINNTPSSSPQKPRDGNRVLKRPFGSSSSSSLLSSPSRQSRTAGSIVYADRFIPNRTGIDLNTLASIGSSASLPPLAPSSTDDQVELQKEIQAHETFDAVLKNELFGEKLVRDAVGKESSIDRIKNTRSSAIDFLGGSNNTVQDSSLFDEEHPDSAPATPQAYSPTREVMVLDLQRCP